MNSLKLKEQRANMREMDLSNMRERLIEAKQELLNLRFQIATGRNDKTHRVGIVKRQIARLHTVIRELELKESK